MSIETDLSRIAVALEQLVAVLSNKASTVTAPMTTVQPVAIAPMPIQQPQVMPQMTAATQELAPLVQVPPVLTPQASPFSFGKQEDGTEHTITSYVMATYRALGPINGAKIQGVLTSLGYSNINEVKQEHYPQFFSGVEALKGA